jgi:GDP-4-dehydro-6-deoxy-D-mannose reductase
VGTHLTALLTGQGVEVVALDLGGDQPLDITDHDAVGARVAEASPDVLYHLAARSHVGESWHDEQLTRVNVDGTRAVLDACVAAAVGRVLVVGSAEQYGSVTPDDLPVRETTPCHPVSPYGETKVAAELLALDAHRRRGLAVVCVRAFNHTGPGQSPTFLVPGVAARIVAAERAGLDEIAIGNGDPVREFNDVRDVVRAYARLAEIGTPGEVYNVCSGRGMRVGDVAAALVDRSTRPLRLTPSPDLARAVDVPALVGDPAKLIAATGWSPEFTLERTLDDVLAAARESTR